jgi:hypothetical protein
VRQPPHRRNSPPAPYKHAHATEAAEVNGRRCHHYSDSIPPTWPRWVKPSGPLQPPIRSHCVVAETIGIFTRFSNVPRFELKPNII